MIIQKIHAISPGTIPDYNEKLQRALCDKDPSKIGLIKRCDGSCTKRIFRKYQNKWCLTV
jgi:hypothetical protein